MFAEINTFLNDLIWGNILIYLLPILGIFFTVSSRFVQFRYFFRMFNILRESVHDKQGHVSSFQALMLSVAGRVGGGNIAGVAVAITLGGAGAVFWMWIIALVGMATSFFECSLAQLYKEKDGIDSCVYRGGPAYYATKALKQKWLGIVISVLLLITFGFAFNATQSFIISTSFEASFNLPTWISGTIITIVFGITIFGGIKRIAKMSEVIVPIMALGYLLIALVVIVLNIDEIPGLIMMIITEAFNPSSAIGGGIGAVIIQGAKRGMFSNEAGLGSAPNVAAVAYVAHPVQQGIVQSFSVFIDTIILCSCTAFIILLSGVYTPGVEGVQGILLTQNALIEHIGSFGGYFVTVALFLFGFSSMIYNYYLAENSLNFFTKGNVTAFNIFRILCILLVIWGSFQDLRSIFAFADLSMGLLAIINLIVITILYKPVLQLIKGYERQLKEGKTPVLRYNDYTEFNIDKETWKEIVDNINDKKTKE
ncbi:alanine/glycine:cation symporter family protein [Arcobacter aquimarinus]|uniref:Sodium:alanine symporter family protein n=1 Tax=Arcobacter aquimarinus TaxID=1315211 RepID=A0AAE7E118_9BACT|nr:alanine/glycine:cation symporter family protein [Arcobacter aquimarinus]MCB9096873.1 alanine:cation symporter family protein [Arcobacter sp.]QKE25462.1 sodium:alanine symporter family protein [Arcobacter aquimarinus]RXI35888.1 sodium:alanine symporter [Arcobacter aquimarinus]